MISKNSSGLVSNKFASLCGKFNLKELVSHHPTKLGKKFKM